MKTLKEQFQNYEVPVDEAGWESIIQDASIVKYNRGRKIRRAALYGAAAVATIGIVTMAILLSRPQEQTTGAPQKSVRQEVALSNAPTANPEPASIPPQAATTRTTSEVAPAPANVPSNNVVAVSATAAGSTVQEPPAAASPLAPQPATAAPTCVPQPTPAPQPMQALTPTPQPSAPATPSAPKAEPDENENPTPQSQTTNKTFFAPNAFSPNDDGVNDIFYVFANIEYTEFELNIYSRNGDHVFQSRSIENGWNGRRNGTGELLPLGVYVYTIKYKTAQQKSGMEKGQILLLQ